MSARYPRPEILEQLSDRNGDAVIEASAGTGKTFTLEHLVVDLLLRTETRIEQILVVTFTDRATGELRARIRAKLEELLALQGDAPGVERGSFWVLDAAARSKLQAALSALDAATIATIHGFCQRALVEQAFESGRLFAETRVDGAESFERAFLDTLRGELARDVVPRPWIHAWLGHRSGGTETLQEALRNCATARGELRPQFEPQRFLSVLTTVPCDAKFEARVLAEITASDLHHSKKKALRNKIPAALETARGWRGRTDVPALLVEARSILDSKAGAYVKENLGTSAAQLELSTALQALNLTAPSFEGAAVQVLLPPILERLARRKRELGQFDYDDLLALLRDALKGERRDELCAAMRTRYQVALVDEFQDTDEVQWEIFSTLFRGRSDGGRLFVIGDPKQAIYAFRGADVQTYLRATRELGEPVPLVDNFRSTPELIGALNTVLDQGDAAPFFTGKIAYDHPVRCGKPELALRSEKGEPVAPVELWHLAARRDLTVGPVIESLGRAIAAELHELLDPDRPGLWLHEPGKARRRIAAGDVFVLTVKTREGLQIGRALRAAGIPVSFFKQEGLFETPEATHLRDLLSAVAAPEDRAARRLAWLTPFFGLSLDEVARAGDVEPEHPLMARLLGWKALADVRDYEQLFARILDESGIVRRELFLAASDRELTNYQHLLELLLEDAHRARGPLSELVDTLDAYIRGVRLPPGENGDLQRLEGDGQAVQIMTVHKSKGLEAPVVFLAGGFSGMGGGSKVPISIFHDGDRRFAWVGKVDASVQPLVDAERDEESQRLLYVGITRAVGRLYLPLVDAPRADEPEVREAGTFWDFRSGIKGPYLQLNDRLRRIRAEKRDAGRFARKVVRVYSDWEQPAPTRPPIAWNPPPELLAPALEDPRPDSLRRGHAGFIVTSYSRMAASRATVREEQDNALFKRDLSTDFVALEPDQLPPGAATGVFVHAVLESLVLERAARATSFERWETLPEVENRVLQLARRHGVEDRHLAHARRLAWNALRSTLLLPRGRSLAGVANAARALREVEFLFPIPEASHPLLATGTGRFSIERGCIKGFIDLLFEDQGLTYFADWKSDLLPSFAADDLARHVADHYGIQERLYALATVRMLGVRDQAGYESRFGGSLYLFLRGMHGDASGAGVHASRPSWAQLVEWERELVKRDDWGMPAA